MSELLWATDVHLDHLPPQDWRLFGRRARDEHPESTGLLITGDIGDAPRICDILEIVQAAYGGPLYFVLGNHDYYRGSFSDVERRVRILCGQVSGLHWLRDEWIRLAHGSALVGADGWYDARHGDRMSDLRMSDFVLIEELFNAQDDSRESLLAQLTLRADRDAVMLSGQLKQAAAAGAARIAVATHIPPYRGAAWYQGQTPDDTWAPFFCSKATGEALSAAASAHPDIEYLVLCGHTHSPGVYRPHENLVVYTGRAQYGLPQLEATLTPGASEMAFASLV